MWNELESYKNHFLQWQLPKYRSERINKLVRREFKDRQECRDHCMFTNNVECNHSCYFKDHTAVAYGFWALPKLMHEIASDLPELRWQAINTLSEYIVNPLNAQRGITEEDIVRKIQNVFLRYRFNYIFPFKNDIMRLLRIFNILSGYLNGATQIAEKTKLLQNFYALILKKELGYYETSKILRNLSEKPKVLLMLIEQEEPLKLLSEIFLSDPCSGRPDPLWMHLSHFLEIVPEKGIEYGLFELCHKRILGRIRGFHNLNMKCFALMLRCEEGQLRFDKIDGVKMVRDIFTDKDVRLCDHEFIVLALLNGLHSKWALWRCREFPDYPSIILHFARTTKNAKQQLYCLRALRQMGEMPCIRRYEQVNVMIQLKSIKCLDDANVQHKDDLECWLRREKYHTDVIDGSESEED